MSRIDTQSPFDQSRQTNHRSVWLTACLAALAIAGLGYLLFAGFGHEPWFPQSLRGLLAEHQDWIFLAGGVALCVLIALLLYRTKAFAGSAQATDGWPSSPDVSVRRKPGP